MEKDNEEHRSLTFNEVSSRFVFFFLSSKAFFIINSLSINFN